jgi:hypothetical protein
MYLMSFFGVPKEILKQLDFMDLISFGKGTTIRKKIKSYRLTKWGVLCLPKEQGGLGIIDLVTQNACLLTLYINQ